MSPPSILSARSSMPTTSAPAARASSAFAPGGQNTATRTDLPVPAGSTVEPRTCWSDFLASTPRRPAPSPHTRTRALAAAAAGHGPGLDDLGLGVRLDQLQRLVEGVGLAGDDGRLQLLVALGNLAH